MGHSDNTMASHYRERIADDRLEAVAEHVRQWLLVRRRSVDGLIGSDQRVGERFDDQKPGTRKRRLAEGLAASGGQSVLMLYPPATDSDERLMVCVSRILRASVRYTTGDVTDAHNATGHRNTCTSDRHSCHVCCETAGWAKGGMGSSFVWLQLAMTGSTGFGI